MFIRGLLTLFCVLSLLKAETPLKKVTLQLSWFNQFQFAGYYIAKEKGFYKEEGIDVQIIPFRFGLNILQSVVDGQRDFAIGRETLIAEKSKGKDIVALYALFQASPLVFLSLESSNINSIEDFRGKRIMATKNDSEEVSLQAMLHSHGILKQDYTFLNHTHNINDLIDGKTDVISAYISKSPYELQKRKIKFKIHSPAEVGFDMYSDFLYTSKAFIQKNITTVTAFKRASLKGWEYAYNHIPETVALILQKYNIQGLTKEELIYEADKLKKLSYYRTNKLGEIQKSKLQRIYDLYNVMGIIKKNIDLNDFVFNNFNTLSEKEKEYLNSKKEIKFCASQDFLPFESIEEGKYIGILADYLQEIESQLHIPFSLVSAKSRLNTLENFKNNKCDILPLAAHLKESKGFQFTSSYLHVPLVLATRKDKFFIEGLSDLKEKKIGVLKGFSLEKTLLEEEHSLKLVLVENTAQGLQKVKSKEIYGLIDTLPAITYELQKNYTETLKIAGKIDQTIPLAFALHPKDKELLQILEKSLEKLSPAFKQNVFSQWVHVKYENSFNYALFWKIMLGFSIILILLFMRYRVIHKYNQKIEQQLDIIDKYVLFSRTDIFGIITDVSEALCKATGYTKEELIGQPQNIFRHPDVPKKIFENMWKTIQSGKNWKGEFPNLRKNGTTYWIEACITPTLDKQGSIEGYSAFHYDITDKKRIEELSITDQLTQISNRLFLDNVYAKEFNKAKRYKSIFSLILMDIDFFKQVNDDYGHSVGDTILVSMSNILKEHIRESDFLGRWGGEEFLIICPNTSRQEAQIVAEKLQIKISQYDFENNIRKTCSFGVTQYEQEDKALETLQRADKALYEAKRQGRNRVIAL